MSGWRLACVAAALLWAAGPAPADSGPVKVVNVETWGLGSAKARPQQTTRMNRNLAIRGRLTRVLGHELAYVVVSPEVVEVQLFAVAPAGAPDGPLHLHCTISFATADGLVSPLVVDQPCFDGRVQDAKSSGGAPLQVDLRFRPNPEDLAGTTGVFVGVQWSDTGDKAGFMLTYDWIGGVK